MIHEGPPASSLRRSLLLRAAFLPAAVAINFSMTLFGVVMTRGPNPDHPFPPMLRLFWVGALPATSYVLLSMPVQYVTRRLVRERLRIAIPGHLAMAAVFLVSHSIVLMGLMAIARTSNPRVPYWVSVERHLIGSLPMNVLVYAAIVAGTLAWDNWRLSIHRERTAAQLAAELTRSELSALRSKMQPHFLFNALHGISSVMDTDVPKARQMMVSLSHLLRASLQAGAEYVRLDQEVQFTRDYLDLQQMRFEDRLGFELAVEARPHLKVPSFILQPIVENAVIHGMADRPDATQVRVAIREVSNAVEIDVSDNGPGFSSGILDGTRSLGVGLSALRGRLLALPDGKGSLALQNHPEGGARVIVRVPVHNEDASNA